MWRVGQRRVWTSSPARQADDPGNPPRFVRTPGQRHDSKRVPEMLDGLQAKALWVTYLPRALVKRTQ
jgi:hypothetical protein